jgi:hypothetical protein
MGPGVEIENCGEPQSDESRTGSPILLKTSSLRSRIQTFHSAANAKMHVSISNARGSISVSISCFSERDL